MCYYVYVQHHVNVYVQYHVKNLGFHMGFHMYLILIEWQNI